MTMIEPDKLKHMLLTMRRIRHFEERLRDFYDYRGFYGEGTVAGDAALTEDLLTAVMYDFDKEGMIGGAVHVYIGQEAVAVGVCAALREGDFVTSTHRGHGHAIAMGLDLGGILAELMGRETGYSRGCGGSIHIFSRDHGILGGNGIVGGSIPIALGPAFAAKYRGEEGVCVGFFGDGGANQGTFHETLNMAALWDLPVVYVCENNLWAASTPTEIAFATPDIADRARAYGIPGVAVDGMDVLAVHAAAREAVDRARGGEGPTLIEARTFRFAGHAGAGQSDHQDPGAAERWRRRDPITLFERRLLEDGLMTADEQQAMREAVLAEVNQAVEFARAQPFPGVDILEVTERPSVSAPLRAAPAPLSDEQRRALADAHQHLIEPIAREYEWRCFLSPDDLRERGREGLERAAEKSDQTSGMAFSDYAAWWIRQSITLAIHEALPPTPTRELAYPQAVAEALREEMERDEAVFLIGEDIGTVREREGLWDALRERRVWQTPISEAGFVGLAVGAAAVGLRPVVEIMYCDFVTVCFDQIVNQAAKLKLMSGNRINVPMVIKTPAGCGTREGGHHSGSHEAWFMHTPGLKVVMPSDAYDAKGLLKSAIRDDGPVVFIQHRLLHRMAQEVPEGEWLVPLGQAALKREGEDLTVVALSYAVPKALQATEALADEISVEVIDPRTLVPLDLATILESIAKTGRLLVVHEAPARGGAGAEIMRRVTAAGFDLLKSAPRVLAGADTAMPYSPPLEDACIPQPADIARVAREMCTA